MILATIDWLSIIQNRISSALWVPVALLAVKARKTLKGQLRNYRDIDKMGEYIVSKTKEFATCEERRAFLYPFEFSMQHLGSIREAFTWKLIVAGIVSIIALHVPNQIISWITFALTLSFGCFFAYNLIWMDRVTDSMGKALFECAKLTVSSYNATDKFSQ